MPLKSRGLSTAIGSARRVLAALAQYLRPELLPNALAATKVIGGSNKRSKLRTVSAGSPFAARRNFGCLPPLGVEAGGSEEQKKARRKV